MTLRGGPPGWLLHFIDDAREGGDHVMDCLLLDGRLEVCLGTELHVTLR